MFARVRIGDVCTVDEVVIFGRRYLPITGEVLLGAQAFHRGMLETKERRMEDLADIGWVAMSLDINGGEQNQPFINQRQKLWRKYGQVLNSGTMNGLLYSDCRTRYERSNLLPSKPDLLRRLTPKELALLFRIPPTKTAKKYLLKGFTMLSDGGKDTIVDIKSGRDTARPIYIYFSDLDRSESGLYISSDSKCGSSSCFAAASGVTEVSKSRR